MSNNALRSYTIKVWRQDSKGSTGYLEEHKVTGISPDSSFLEMMDLLNEQIMSAKDGKGQYKRPIEFESDCREGICGTCGLVINGQAHGPRRAVATCQIYMRDFPDGCEIVIEPWRAEAALRSRDEFISIASQKLAVRTFLPLSPESTIAEAGAPGGAAAPVKRI